MILAIVDSGVNKSVFEKHEINQYKIQAGMVIEERAEDIAGHGTSMLGIILRKQAKAVSVLSLRPIICEDTIDNEDIAAAIKFAVDKGANIISISMGTNILKSRRCVEDACKYAYGKGVAVVCAFSKRNDVILPWACKYVIKVMHGDEKKPSVQFKKKNFDSYMICVNMPMYRTVDVSGKSKMIVGHSAATAYITGEIIQYMGQYLCNSINTLPFFFSDHEMLYNEQQLYNKVETIKGSIQYLDEKKIVNWGASAVIPYSKEMESLIKFEDFGLYNIKVAVDYGKKGIRQEISQDKAIPIETSLEQLEQYNIDSVIVGYLDKLECYSDVWSLEYVLQFALARNYNIFSFLPVPSDIKEQFKEKHLILQEAKVYDSVYFRKVSQVIPYTLLCRLPVLGVFGTSSKQGKFTLQMLIRRELRQRCIKHISLLTEHQAELLDASICFPLGYRGERNILINIEEQIEVLQKTLYYLEQTTDAEMILAGGQSWLIPFDIDRQTAIHNLAYLEAIRPDFSVVVVNPEVDNIAYIHDTINVLQSLYKTRTIAIAFSDKKVIVRGRTVLKKPRDIQNIMETTNYLQKEMGIYAGCISDCDFINEIVNSFINLTS